MYDNIIYIHVVTDMDDDKRIQQPLHLPYEVYDERKEEELTDSLRAYAYQYDIHKEIKQISVLVSGEKPVHFLNTAQETDLDTAVISSSEQKLMLCGWDVFWNTWPIIMYKWLKYDCCAAHRLFKEQLENRFPKHDYLLELGNVYTQCVRTSMRRLPALRDILDDMLITPTHSIDWHSDIQARKAIQEDPKKAVEFAEDYLYGMLKLHTKYEEC